MKGLLIFVVVILFTFHFSTTHTAENGTSNESSSTHSPVEDSVDTLPVLVKSVKPPFPYEAKVKGIEGEVYLRFIVTKEGSVEEPEVIRSLPPGVFDDTALTAIMKYRFKPATKDGVPVDCTVIMPMTFEFNWGDSGYDFYLLFEEGIGFTNSGEYQKGIEVLSKAIRIYNKFGPAFSIRSIAYMGIGENKRAISDINRAIKIDPEEGRYYYQRGEMYNISGDFQKAIEDFSQAIKIYPDMTEAYNSRGNIYRELGKYKEAIQDYTKVISLDDGHVQAYNNRGYSYNRLNDMENTCIDLKKACELGDCRGLDILNKSGACMPNEADAEGEGGKS